MGYVIAIIVIALFIGSVVLNHRHAAQAAEGVSFVVPHPPSVVVTTIQRAHNEGAMAALRGAFAGISVTSDGHGVFMTRSKIGDSGEITVAQDPAGSLVSARALSLLVGSHPKTHRFAYAGINNALCKMLGLTPGSARFARWQKGLESRITKQIIKSKSSA